MQGQIIKGIGGFYYIDTEIGILEAKGRGIFKKDGITLEVGDYCDIEILDRENLKGVIEKIYPRKNQFIRPPIVNCDTFAITFACDKPKPNFQLIDKFVVMSEMNNVEVIIVINKCDLLDSEELNKISSIYSGLYPVFLVSAKEGKGIAELDRAISGKTVCFAGPSGVGKSTIINHLIPGANTETGEISEKTLRGKHTTRHVEIFKTDMGGKVFDTPGFTSFEIMEAEEAELQDLYLDIAKYKGKCQYDNCRHLKEPNCGVREAVKAGYINKIRYESYVANIEEIRQKKKYRR